MVAKQSKYPPKYMVGAVIAGGYYAGTIINAFFANNEWNYAIGNSASVEAIETLGADNGYLTGPKYIHESDVKWVKVMNSWTKVN